MQETGVEFILATSERTNTAALVGRRHEFGNRSPPFSHEGRSKGRKAAVKATYTRKMPEGDVNEPNEISGGSMRIPDQIAQKQRLVHFGQVYPCFVLSFGWLKPLQTHLGS